MRARHDIFVPGPLLLLAMLGSCHPPVEPKPPVDPPATVSSCLDEINAVRAKRRKPAYQESECLAAEAQAHAEWMKRRRRLTHSGWMGRLAECGHRGGSENIAQGQRSESEVVADWMSSSGHRANILGDWTVAGCGRSGDYWCVLFAKD